MRALVLAANQDPALQRVFSTWATNNPQVFLDIDREKAQTLGVAISDIFTALQATLGGYYVNDFNQFGRVWQVKVQGEEGDRQRFDDVYRIHVRNSKGEMVPIRALMAPELILGPQLIQRYNNYRSVTIQGGPGPGRSPPATPWRPWSGSRAKTLPAGFGFEWTGTAFQEKEAGGKTLHRARAGRALRLPVPGRALRELVHARGGAAVGHRRRARRHGRALGHAACPTTSMPRSASWC